MILALISSTDFSGDSGSKKACYLRSSGKEFSHGDAGLGPSSGFYSFILGGWCGMAATPCRLVSQTLNITRQFYSTPSSMEWVTSCQICSKKYTV